ncbi:unnamed protein product [Peronospora destructor]|uniref:Uncharacterized protein n=1 Tax=Peronospora destructor TaxID=86335 RepID=A0AAV0V5J6_9STRA|nr:unnamed protein product [Peronospora destructor]
MATPLALSTERDSDEHDGNYSGFLSSNDTDHDDDVSSSESDIDSDDDDHTSLSYSDSLQQSLFRTTSRLDQLSIQRQDCVYLSQLGRS